MRIPAQAQAKSSPTHFSPTLNRLLQRKCACGGGAGLDGECEACRGKRLQRRSGNGVEPATVPPIVHEVLRSPGQPLDAQSRAFFEPRFGHDFSDVRVHNDARAAESAKAVNALAYTIGQDMIFGGGRYAPTENSGQRLLAHELTHVVQQNKSPLTSSGRHESIIKNNFALEQEAQTMSNLVFSSGGNLSLQTSQAQVGIYCDNGAALSSPVHSEEIWGFRVTRAMCGCRSGIRSDISWANQARDSYRACNVPAFTSGAEVENCFDARHPGATVAAETSPSGEVTLPPPTSNPCERINRRAFIVHEEFHVRQGNRIARSLGSAFWTEWNRLRGTPDRLDRMRASFPTEVAAFERQWNDAHDWAQSEVESYTWERRFLADVLRALQRICSS